MVRNGVYTSGGVKRKRDLCEHAKTHTSNTFSAFLPRAVVAAEKCCDDRRVPTPANAGAEASARHHTFSMPVIHMVLRDLAMGKPYASVSVTALDEWVEELSGRGGLRCSYAAEKVKLDVTHATATLSGPVRSCPVLSCPVLSCPKDVVYQLVTKRALAFGTESLVSRLARDDLFKPGRWRRMDTWTRHGMPAMSAYMMWLVVSEYDRAGNVRRVREVLGM